MSWWHGLKIRSLHEKYKETLIDINFNIYFLLILRGWEEIYREMTVLTTDLMTNVNLEFK